MNEYDIKDYGIFTDAIATTKNYIETIRDAEDTISNAKTKIGNESIFMGPIQENCMEEFQNVTQSLTGYKSDYEKLNNYLTATSQSYQKADTDATKTISDTVYRV